MFIDDNMINFAGVSRSQPADIAVAGDRSYVGQGVRPGDDE
jgi:hypothetical protein